MKVRKHMSKPKKCTKRNRRNAKQFPALEKNYNLPSRADFIEPDYVNGVYDDEGNCLIRPCTDEEKKFLNDFYSETVITDFYHHPELRRLMRKKMALVNNDPNLKGIKKKIKSTKNKKEKSRLKAIRNEIKKQIKEKHSETLNEIENEIREIQEKELLYSNKEMHKVFYNENNNRNNCVYNKMKTNYKLDYYESIDYDSTINSNIDYEDKLIEQLERSMYEELEDQWRKIRQSEKRSHKPKKSNK